MDNHTMIGRSYDGSKVEDLGSEVKPYRDMVEEAITFDPQPKAVAQYTATLKQVVDLSQFEADLAVRFDEARSLLVRKHRDYGPGNIAGAPGGPLNGLRVRMHDKLARINHLLDTGADPQNESLRDSFLDLANYSVIALMVIDGRWPTK